MHYESMDWLLDGKSNLIQLYLRVGKQWRSMITADWTEDLF